MDINILLWKGKNNGSPEYKKPKATIYRRSRKVDRLLTAMA